MSDYVHEKVVRLPFPKDFIDKYGDDPFESEKFLREKLHWKNVVAAAIILGCVLYVILS